MRVFVTGGDGRIGRVTTQYLIQKGYDVTVAGIIPDVNIKGARYVVCDITDYDQLHKSMTGHDCVVHLAAIPSPVTHPAHELIRVNVSGTTNVYEAAAKLGIKRVVQASSINAIGCAWNLYDFKPHYFPIDEAHPRNISDPYSLSKQMVEEIAAYYWQRDSISGTSLRFPAVFTLDYLADELANAKRIRSRESIHELSEQPESIQRAQIDAAHRQVLEYRIQRPLEYEYIQTHESKSIWESDDWLWTVINWGAFNLWAYIDVRDAATVIELSLSGNYEGSHNLFANSRHNWLNYNTETLLQMFFHDVTARKRIIEGSHSLVDMQAANDLLGFEPQYKLKD